MNAIQPAQSHDAPQRTCIGCGRKHAKEDLLRLVLDADGQIRVDRDQRAPGRGAYLCGPGCLKGALKRKSFGRAFRGRALPFDPLGLEGVL